MITIKINTCPNTERKRIEPIRCIWEPTLEDFGVVHNVSTQESMDSIEQAISRKQRRENGIPVKHIREIDNLFRNSSRSRF